LIVFDASAAETIVTTDDDLLVLRPWRGTRILRPADYLALTQTGSPIT
jgi:predicted nucleic acid-binding protein